MMEKTGSKHTELSDHELIALAKESDQAAFASLLARYRDALTKHIQNYVPLAADAEDICQRSFEKAFMNVGRYNPEYAFSTWLYNIAQNEAIDHLRRMRTSPSPLSLAEAPSTMDIPVPGTPEDQLIVDQAVARIVALIENLPQGYREVARLRFIKDYAYEDISAMLSLPIGTVKTRINRARAMLVKQIEKVSHEEDIR